jgi:hypothetical protein
MVPYPALGAGDCCAKAEDASALIKTTDKNSGLSKFSTFMIAIFISSSFLAARDDATARCKFV